jgi:N-acyl-D-aspartate/D-glutamate deacylase
MKMQGTRILYSNAVVIDGTGDEPVTGDVAVDAGKSIPRSQF